MPSFEWDPRKEERNLSKHHVNFTTASLIWEGPVFEKIDDRRDYGEIRIVAVGEVENRTMTVAFTWREDTRRIISARKANPREKRLFEEEVGRRGRPLPG